MNWFCMWGGEFWACLKFTFCFQADKCSLIHIPVFAKCVEICYIEHSENKSLSQNWSHLGLMHSTQVFWRILHPNVCHPPSFLSGMMCFGSFSRKKGTTTDDGRYIFLNKEDFVRCSWDGQRDQLLDKLGDGVRPDYPIKVRPFISQSPRNYILSDGQMKPSPRYYTERLSIHCRKQPFTVL